MDALLYFALWAGVIFFMMRFGCGAHVMGYRHGEQGERATSEPPEARRWIPPKTDIDPVCGKTIDTAAARSSVHDGWVYYFCSAECRERFEADPGLYLSRDGPRPTQLEHSHG